MKITIILLTLLSVSISAKEYCKPDKKKNLSELSMSEADFNYEKGIESIRLVEKIVHNALKAKKKSIDVLDYEGFYISFPNTLFYAEGSMLKLKLELLEEQIKTAKKGSKKKLQSEFKKVKEEFCDFVSSSTLVD